MRVINPLRFANLPHFFLPLLLSVGCVLAESPEEWRKIGLAHIAKNELKAARPAFEKACELAPAPGDSCYYLARTLLGLGEYQAASKAFDLALKKAPSDLIARVYRYAALNHMALGKDTEAERDFGKAIELGAAETRVDLGAFLFRRGRLADASKILQQAAKDNPESARANLELGRVLLQLDQLDDAVKLLENAVHLDPAEANAHLLLGRAYQRLGRDADAQRELQLGQDSWRRKQP